MIELPPFGPLTDTEAKAREVLAGSCVGDDLDDFVASLAAWERARRFLVQALRPTGSLLDYGCANGYLLRCLLEWSGHELTPFGIEIDRERLALARELFPGREQNFEHPDGLGQAAAFPTYFDQVYWAVGDNLDFGRPDHQRWLGKVLGLTAPGGRFAMGFYDTPEANRAKLDQLTATGFVFDEVRWNDGGDGEAVAWLDR